MIRRTRARHVAGLLVGCALALFIWRAAAQTGGTGIIAGRVTDQHGNPVSEASVILTNASSGQRLVSFADRDGTYAFRAARADVDFEVRAEHSGLVSNVHTLRLSVDEKAGIDLQVRPPIVFKEIAEHAGLNFTLRNGESGRAFQPEIMLGGVAAIDYDNDGCMDLFFTNGAELPSGVKRGAEFQNRVFRNDCTGAFTDVTAKARLGGEGYSIGAAAGDFDNDGFTDLFVTGLDGGRLYRNRGDGVFEDVTSKAGLRPAESKIGQHWSVSAGWFDYDNDGDLDLFVTNYVAWEPEAETKCAMNGRPYYCHPRVYRGLPNQLFRNNGNGTFTDVSEQSGIGRSVGKGMGVAFGDFDGDGFLDIFVANDSTPNFLFRNLGNGLFREVAVETGVAYPASGSAIAGMGADFRDFDDDGFEDIALDAMYFDTFPLFRNRGAPRFFSDETATAGISRATSELTGWGMGSFDFDNDGHKDLFYATSHFPGSDVFVHAAAATASRVLRNTGDSFFEDVSSMAGADFRTTGLFRGAAFADFDNDGRVDIAVSAINGTARLFRNVSPQDSHWVALRLAGARSNRYGLGARIRLTLPSGAHRYNRVTTTVGYASSSEPLVRFGLGPYDFAAEVQIRWPGGRLQTINRIPANRLVTVQEPQ